MKVDVPLKKIDDQTGHQQNNRNSNLCRHRPNILRKGSFSALFFPLARNLETIFRLTQTPMVNREIEMCNSKTIEMCNSKTILL